MLFIYTSSLNNWQLRSKTSKLKCFSLSLEIASTHANIYVISFKRFGLIYTCRNHPYTWEIIESRRLFCRDFYFHLLEASVNKHIKKNTLTNPPPPQKNQK